MITTKDQKIQVLEEKLKKLEHVKIESSMKQSFKGGNLDSRITSYNKLKTNDLQPFPRRPVAESKAHKYRMEKDPEYKSKPYDNFLGSK